MAQAELRPPKRNIFKGLMPYLIEEYKVYIYINYFLNKMTLTRF